MSYVKNVLIKNRFWNSMSAVYIRDVQMRGSIGHGSAGLSISKPYEHDQGHHAGIAEPADTGGCGASQREKACGCSQSVLRRERMS